MTIKKRIESLETRTPYFPPVLGVRIDDGPIATPEGELTEQEYAARWPRSSWIHVRIVNEPGGLMKEPT